jgi:Tol biopolymer transport system component
MTIAVTPDGVDESTRRMIPVAYQGTQALCPRWSADGKRIAYMDNGPIVRTLDGATLAWTDADPGIADFAPDTGFGDQIASPSADRFARMRKTCEVEVWTAGGPARTLDVGFCPYSIAAWSPDGKRLILMESVPRQGFTIHAVTIDDPSGDQVIASTVPTNSPGSLPGRGDVAWQPVFD